MIRSKPEISFTELPLVADEIPDISFTELSLVADEIVDSIKNGNNNIAEISEEPLKTEVSAIRNTGPVNDRLSKLEESISRMEKSLKKLSNNKQHNTQNDTQQNSNTSTLCWYHFKFSNNAKQCRQPCTFH